MFALFPLFTSIAENTVKCSAIKKLYQTATLTDQSTGCCSQHDGAVDTSSCVASSTEVDALKHEVETLRKNTRVSLSEAGLPMSDNFQKVVGDISATAKSSLFLKTFYDPSVHPSDTNATLARVRLTDAWSKDQPFSTQSDVFIGPHAIAGFLNKQQYEEFEVFVEDGYTWIRPTFTESMRKEYDALHEFLGFSTFTPWQPRSQPSQVGPQAKYTIGFSYSVGARKDVSADGTPVVTSAFPSDTGGKRYIEFTTRLSHDYAKNNKAADTDLTFLEWVSSTDAAKHSPPVPKFINPTNPNETKCHTTGEYGTRCYFVGNTVGWADKGAANQGYDVSATNPAKFVATAWRVRETEETFFKFTPRMYIRDDDVYPINVGCTEAQYIVTKNVTDSDGNEVEVHACAEDKNYFIDGWSSRFVSDDLYVMRGGKNAKAPFQSEITLLYDTQAEDTTHGTASVSLMFDGVPVCGQAGYTAGAYTEGFNPFAGKKLLFPSGEVRDIKNLLNLPPCTGDSFYKAPVASDILPKLFNTMVAGDFFGEQLSVGDVRWETFDALPHRWTTDGIRAAKMASPVPVHKEDIVPTSYPADPPMLQTFPPGVFRNAESDLASHVTKRVHILPVSVGGEERTAAVTVYEPVEHGSTNDVFLYVYHAEGTPVDDLDSDNNYMHQFALSMDMPVVAFRPPGTNTFDGPTKRVRYDGWVGSALRTLGLANRNMHVLCYTRGCNGAELMMKDEADMQGIRIKAAYYGAAFVTGPWEQVPYIPGYLEAVYLSDASKSLRQRTDAVYDAIHQYGTRYTPANSDDTSSILNDALYDIAYALTFGNFWDEMLPYYRSMFTGQRQSTVQAWKNTLTATFASGNHAAAKDALASLFTDGSVVPSYPSFVIVSGRPEKTIVGLSPDDAISRLMLRKHTRGDGASHPDAPSVEDVPGVMVVMSPSLPTPFKSAGHSLGIHVASRAMHLSEESVLKEGSVTPWYGETLLDAKVDVMVSEYGLDRSRLVFSLYGGIVFAYDAPTVAEWDAYVAGTMSEPRPVTMYALYVQKNLDKFIPAPGHTFPEWQLKDAAGVEPSWDAPNTVTPRMMTNVHTHIAPQIKAHFLERGYNLTQLLDGSDNVLYAESLKTTSLTGTNPRGYAMLTVLGDNAVQTYAYVGFNASFPIPEQSDTNTYFQDERIAYVFQQADTQYDNSHEYPYHAATHPLSLFHHPEMKERGVLPNGKTIYVHTEESVALMKAVDGLKDMYSPAAGADIDYHEFGNIHNFRVASSILSKASVIHPDYSSKYIQNKVTLWGINHPGTSRFGDTCDTLDIEYCGEGYDSFKGYTNPFLPDAVCTNQDRSGCALSSGQACPLTCMRAGINHPGTNRFGDTCDMVDTQYCDEAWDVSKTFTNPFLPDAVCTGTSRDGCTLSTGQACPQTCGRSGFDHPGTDRFNTNCATFDTQYCAPAGIKAFTNPFLPDTVCTATDRSGCALSSREACPQRCASA